MNGDETHHHWAVQWVYTRWPKWVKIGSLIAAIAGGLGTVMGFGGTIVNAIHARDTKMQAEAIAKELDKQHDGKVDSTLDEHTKQIKEIQTGVQQVQTHLSTQDVEMLGTKDQLNRIETAIMAGNAPHVALPTIAPSP